MTGARLFSLFSCGCCLTVVGAGLAPALSANVVFGTLEIHTEPGATVLWDNHSLGSTDSSGRMVISQIPLGPYTLSLQKEGFSDWSQRITVQSGSQPLLIELNELALPTAQEDLALSQDPQAAIEKVSAPSDAEESLAPAVPSTEKLASDPVSTGTSSVGMAAFVLILALIAVGAYFLGRQHTREPQPTPEAPRPHLIAERPQRWSRAQPAFYSDIKDRESALDGFRETGHESPEPEIVDIEPSHKPESEEGV